MRRESHTPSDAVQYIVHRMSSKCWSTGQDISSFSNRGFFNCDTCQMQINDSDVIVTRLSPLRMYHISTCVYTPLKGGELARSSMSGCNAHDHFRMCCLYLGIEEYHAATAVSVGGIPLVCALGIKDQCWLPGWYDTWPEAYTRK